MKYSERKPTKAHLGQTYRGAGNWRWRWLKGTGVNPKDGPKKIRGGGRRTAT